MNDIHGVAVVDGRTSMRHLLICLAVLTVSLSGTRASGETDAVRLSAAAYLIKNYDRTEQMIPMRDGVSLHTEIYTPKDRSTAYPILLNRTPYSAFFTGERVEGFFSWPGPGPTFPEEGYIFVIQDVRGRFLSEGDFVVMRPNTAGEGETDESTDAYDTVDWLVNNLENNNGKVGVWGLSYGGYFSALALVNAHPAISAVVIEAPVAEGFIGDDYHHNGALQLLYPFRWINNVGLALREVPSATPVPPVYRDRKDEFFTFFLETGSAAEINDKCFQGKIEFWNGIVEHGTYDEFWKSRMVGQYMKDIDGPAVLVSGTWFDDQDLYGTLHTYRAIEEQNPGISNTLVMGVWNHASWWEHKKKPWGGTGIPVKETGEYYRDEVLAPFLKAHLKGDGKIDLPEALVVENGKDEWREYESWPPEKAETVSFYMHGDGTVSTEIAGKGTDGFSEFISDPADPVPHLPVPILGWTAAVMHADQRFAEERDDVLVYIGGVLDKDLTFAGPVEADIFVSTTGTDADWIVKVIDVYPDNAGELAGYQMLVRGDIMRGKFRNSFEIPEPFVPGEVTRVRFTLPDVNHTFRSGHRVMIQVQSSWFPMFDRNPQTFVDIYRAEESDFVKATHRLFHSPEHPSRITARALP
jgi:putative CocE/NonD family hydrolase